MGTPQLKTLIVLFKTHQHLLNHVRQSIANTGLSINEFTAMEALHAKGVMTTQQLAESVLIPNSSLTYVLDGLEKKQLINRQKGKQDARILELVLTSEGKRHFRDIYRHHYEQLRPIFDILSPDQEHELQESLKLLGKFAQQELSK